MNCLLCNQEMEQQPISKYDEHKSWKCNCNLRFYMEDEKPGFFWFQEWFNNRWYQVRYYIDTNIMSVIDSSLDAGLPVIFEANYNKPSLTPQNLEQRLPTLLNFL